MKALRSLAAVVVGYLLFAVPVALFFFLSGHDPHADQPLRVKVVSMTVGMFFGGLGGGIAARIAPTRPALHTAITALLIITGAIVSLITSPATDATWSMWGAILFIAPCSWYAGVRAAAK